MSVDSTPPFLFQIATNFLQCERERHREHTLDYKWAAIFECCIKDMYEQPLASKALFRMGRRDQQRKSLSSTLL